MSNLYTRFGAEFPIRFDFLDTMGGQNLSLQVHPLNDYIYEQFGMHYTQDESYYMLDAKEDAVVYLGLKDDVDPEAMIGDLERAQTGEISFPAQCCPSCTEYNMMTGQKAKWAAMLYNLQQFR